MKIVVRFNAVDGDTAIDPEIDDRLKQTLEVLLDVGTLGGAAEVFGERQQVGMVDHDVVEAAAQDVVGVMLVELIDDVELGKGVAGFLAIRLSRQSRRILMADGGAGDDSVEGHPSLCEMPTELPRLFAA